VILIVKLANLGDFLQKFDENRPKSTNFEIFPYSKNLVYKIQNPCRFELVAISLKIGEIFRDFCNKMAKIGQKMAKIAKNRSTERNNEY